MIGVAVAVVGLLVLATIATGGGALALAGVGASATAAATATSAASATVAAGLTVAGGSLIYAASSTGGRTPTQLGKEGERQAGINPKGKSIIQVNNRIRIPDELKPDLLREVKNVKYISNTLQLRDFASFASSTSRSLELVVRAGAGTKVAKTVIEAGWKIVPLIK